MKRIQQACQRIRLHPGKIEYHIRSIAWACKTKLVNHWTAEFLSLPPQGGLAKIILYSSRLASSFWRMSMQSPWYQEIWFCTPYNCALCWAQANALESFSMAYIRLHLPERAKAMVLPPTPAKQSISTAFSGDVASETCRAIALK